MIIKVLAENVSSSESLGKEHGLSIYIETGDQRLLFDTGASGLFAENSVKMSVDLARIDSVIISHGHYDHGGGLKTFLGINCKASVYLHKNAFGAYYEKADSGNEYIGLDKTLLSDERFIYLEKSCFISSELKILTGVKGRKFFPAGNSDLMIKRGEEFFPDEFIHEQNLIIYMGEKKVLITGCAHNGIVNILEHFAAEEGSMPDYVIGGFHLINPTTNLSEDPAVLDKIAAFFLDTKAKFYTGHCTGLESFKYLKDVLGGQIEYLSTGTSLIL